jgi:hypothetical protein
MKTTNLTISIDVFTAYEISSEEMLYIRGGEGDPAPKPTTPPVIV